MEYTRRFVDQVPDRLDDQAVYGGFDPVTGGAGKTQHG